MDHNENKSSALETAQTVYAWASLVVGTASAVYVGTIIASGAAEVVKEKIAARRARKATKTEEN